MALRTLVHRTAMKAETAIDRVWPGSDAPPVLEAYRGYATPDGAMVRGRVLTAIRRTRPNPENSKLTNLRQIAGLFLTTEVAHVVVKAVGRDLYGTTDEEGYLLLEVPIETRAPGWRDIPLRIEGSADTVPCPVMIPDPEARFGVISDIDDTMMETGAYSLARNLWTTFTGSALTRSIFRDSKAMMHRLRDEAKAPIFYVSSSPWNLHAFLNRVFARNDLPDGPMFLRDLGIGEKQFVTGTHGDHKGSAIDRILAANPDLPFVLVGDTGQHDAEIYHAAQARHPERIKAILLRQAGPTVGPKVKKAKDRIRETDVVFHADKSFDGAADAVLAAL